MIQHSYLSLEQNMALAKGSVLIQNQDDPEVRVFHDMFKASHGPLLYDTLLKVANYKSAFAVYGNAPQRRYVFRERLLILADELIHFFNRYPMEG